jgi:FtsZ-binding cell division protein ZapB
MILKKYRLWRNLLIFFLTTAFLVVLTGILLARYWNPILVSTLKKTVHTSTSGLYRIDFSKMSINLFTGNIYFKDFKLIPDTTVYRKLRLIDKAPPYLYEISVSDIRFKRIHPWKIYEEHALDISEIQINKPDIKVISKFQKRDDTSGSVLKNPYELIRNLIPSVQVNLIQLNDIHFTYVQERLWISESNEVEVKQIRVEELRIDSMAQFDTSRPFYAKDIQVLVKDFSHIMPDNIHTLSFSDALLSTASSSVGFSNFRYSPKYPEQAYARHFATRKERYDIGIHDMTFSGIDFIRLINYQQLHVDQLAINKLLLKGFIDKQKPVDPHKVFRFPQEVVKRIKLPFEIDQVTIASSDIHYSEVDVRSGVQWRIFFTKTNADIRNFSNDSMYRTAHPYCTASLNTMFMNEASIKTTFRFDHLRKESPFVCQAEIGTFRFRKLNDLLAPLTKVESSSGQLDRMNVEIRGDIYNARAKMTFLYNDLKIRVLKADDEANSFRSQGFISLLANALVVKRSNPDQQGTRTVNVYYKRIEDQSFFGFIWKTMLRGIKESIGLDHKTEEEIRQRVSTLKALRRELTELKEERMERRGERIENRRRRKEKRTERSQRRMVQEGGRVPENK